jgi:hypothetical protein
MKFIKIITKLSVHSLFFWPIYENRPAALSTRPRGLAAQQPTARPPNQPAHPALLGQKTAHQRPDARSDPWPSILMDGPPALSPRQNRPPRPNRLQTLALSLFSLLLSDPHRRRRVKRRWPPCSPATVRPSAARPEAAGVSPLSFSLCFSFPLCLCRAPAAAGLSTL